MESNSEKVNLFAHPVTFVLTHVVFPLFAVGALGYVYWITVESLAKAEGSLGTQMLVALCAAAAIPIAAVLRLAVGPKRIDVVTQIGFALVIVAFAYFAFPVMGEATRKVDSWIIGPTVFLSFIIGIVPPVFAGVARIATADWKLSFGADLGLTLLMTVGGPFGVYVIFQIINAIWRMVYEDRGSCFAKTVSAITGHLVGVGVVLGSLVLFIGFLRLLHLIASRFVAKNERMKRIVTALVFGLALPWGGLALNLHIPFPADFANSWLWVLSAVTTLSMIVETKPSRGGLVLWFLKFMMAPFVLYFFLLFVPFLPLAVLAILAMGAGFLILAPTLLFRYYTANVYDAWKVLRGAYSKARLLTIAALGILVIPLGFVVDVELERTGLKALVKWHTEEDFDAPSAPLPVSKRQAERIVKNANAFADGAEIPFLSAWRTFRVYDGMYMSDSLREELNQRILGKRLSKAELDWNRRRNIFGAGMFGMIAGRRNNRNAANGWTTRPPRTKDFEATCESKGSGEYLLKVHAKKVKQWGWQDQEFIAPFRLPAGTWIEGMRLKMDDGTWKVAKASERKAAEFVYRHITEQRRDPSIITLDTPTSGTLKIFPVGEKGRDVEITLRTTALFPLREPIVIGEQTVPSVECYGLYSPLVTAKDADVTLVSPAWMDAHTNELIRTVAGCDVVGFSLDDPEFKGDLRRHMRMFATTMATNAPGVMPSFEFTYHVSAHRGYGENGGYQIPATNMVVESLVDLPKDYRLPESFLTTLRREFPGVEAFGDRPLDGWYMLETEDGGKVAVPYRKGEGALVFAKVKGATVDDGKWSDGAKLWAREREAFLKPALDLRQELLDGTRTIGVLTTQSAYLAVETSAQEKALKQKEMEALYGNKAFDFEEPLKESTSGDAPGVLLILGGFMIVLLIRRFAVLRRLVATSVRRFRRGSLLSVST